MALALGALPLIAVVALLVYGAVRPKPDTKDAQSAKAAPAAWSPQKVALLVLAAAGPGLAALALTLSRPAYDPSAAPPIGPPAVKPPSPAPGPAPAEVSPPAKSELNALRSEVVELRDRLNALQGRDDARRGGAVEQPSAAYLVVQQLPIYAVLAVLVFVLARVTRGGYIGVARPTDGRFQQFGVVGTGRDAQLLTPGETKVQEGEQSGSAEPTKSS